MSYYTHNGMYWSILIVRGHMKYRRDPNLSKLIFTFMSTHKGTHYLDIILRHLWALWELATARANNMALYYKFRCGSNYQNRKDSSSKINCFLRGSNINWYLISTHKKKHRIYFSRSNLPLIYDIHVFASDVNQWIIV